MAGIMTPRKVLILAGTRPEVIKLAPVVRAIQDVPELAGKFCVTGQHRQMLQQALDDMELCPDMDMHVMVHDQTLTGLTAALLPALDSLYTAEKPDMVLVQGDTTTVLTASLAAFYHKIPVAHVEAGLRSFDPLLPFPEEINRKLTGAMAHLHFAPTEGARSNLLREGISPDHVHITGNTVIDALLWAAQKTRGRDDLLPPAVSHVIAQGKDIVLVTAHRRENYENSQLKGICQGILQACTQCPEAHFIYPVHLNPRVREPVLAMLGGHSQISLLPALNYLPFVALMQRARLVLTDSGGVQEEAPSLGKPVLVMRTVTERPEGVASGNACLVGTDAGNIARAISTLLRNDEQYARMSTARNPYGDGQSAQRIVNIIRNFLHSLLCKESCPHAIS